MYEKYEKCEKNPSFYRFSCSHCMGTARGTEQNPNFSLVEIDENGSPLVEILKNGAQIHRFDAHFRFGTSKAEMLLACLLALKQFGWSSTQEKMNFEPRVFVIPRHGTHILVFVEMHEDFEYSTGELIQQPWLQLQELPSREVHLGLGVMKCRAVWSVQEELGDWLARHG
jgi:hypothetical protein